jgi:hypothetical protein
MFHKFKTGEKIYIFDVLTAVNFKIRVFVLCCRVVWLINTNMLKESDAPIHVLRVYAQTLVYTYHIHIPKYTASHSRTPLFISKNDVKVINYD